jgi:hypothetical protein
MSDGGKLPGRPAAGTLVLTALFLFVIVDLLIAEPIDPYQAPYPTALGSGQIPSGAHCTNVSGID